MLFPYGYTYILTMYILGIPLFLAFQSLQSRPPFCFVLKIYYLIVSTLSWSANCGLTTRESTLICSISSDIVTLYYRPLPYLDLVSRALIGLSAVRHFEWHTSNETRQGEREEIAKTFVTSEIKIFSKTKKINTWRVLWQCYIPIG